MRKNAVVYNVTIVAGGYDFLKKFGYMVIGCVLRNANSFLYFYLWLSKSEVSVTKTIEKICSIKHVLFKSFTFYILTRIKKKSVQNFLDTQYLKN